MPGQKGKTRLVVIKKHPLLIPCFLQQGRYTVLFECADGG
ncbi:hypothetical protein SB48_HM08orf05457 [Heyndrickxia coagulans]|uniref:Uncharacterized protein n=1 Tax=Heyndrickxia coagulans TaxID=1398 RepID=A0AAN0T7E9_HEYCO|nr:hypothetical protein SB48_HM08orf05457 [Heyndrickxia coagulans]